MGAVASKRRRRAGEGGGATHQQHDPTTTTTPPTLVVGLGDAMLDLIVADVPHERLRDLGIERGGCVQVPSAQIDALLDALHAPPPPPSGGGGGGDAPASPATRPEGFPGGSAANVIKGMAGLARATGAADTGSLVCRFAGMVARDGAGERYASALAEEGVEPLLLRAGEEEGAEPSSSTTNNDNDDDDLRATARCLCLVTPDGERTMRTCLGAAARLASAERQLAPRRWLELSSSSSSSNAQPPQPHRLLVHLEGYSLYRPELAAGALRQARAKGGSTSLDLASFELVRARHALLLDLLKEGLVDLLFCNEDEACALAEAVGLGVKGKEEEGDETDKRARAAAAAEEATTTTETTDLPSISPAAAAAQRYLVEKGAGLCVVSLGARGCAALARKREQQQRPTTSGGGAKPPLERAGARACALRSALVDTVGAGDTFTAGFLFAWLRGWPLGECCALACAAGAEVVQVAGASLGPEGWQRAWRAGGGGKGVVGGAAASSASARAEGGAGGTVAAAAGGGAVAAVASA